MKLFIMCPLTLSGGPEALHQLCNACNASAPAAPVAYMIYVVPAQTEYTILQSGWNLYDAYTRVLIANRIEDIESNVLIIPEVFDSTHLHQRYPRIQKVIWWLSISYAIQTRAFFKHVRNKVFNHACQSKFAYDMIKRYVEKCFYLSDYICPIFWRYVPVQKKQDRVVFNGLKDDITKYLCREHGIPCIAIANMDKTMVMNALASSKVYVDMGSHPGKDRLPREARILNCVVVTNRHGSAFHHEDVPIHEKINGSGELIELIKDIFVHYDAYLQKQASFKAEIWSQHSRFDAQVQSMIHRLSQSAT